MADYGVVDEGFAKKALTDILEEIQESERTTIDTELNLTATSVLGQLNGVFADKLRELWDVSQAIYRAQFPDSASGEALDGVASITGATRLGPTESQLNAVATGTPTTVLSTGRIISTVTGDRFISAEDKTIAAATPHTPGPFALGDFVVNDTPDRIYVCVQAGNSGLTGPTGIGDGIVDGNCLWDYVGEGTGYVEVPWGSEELNAIAAPAGAVHTDLGNGAIETPVSGWDATRNLEDADIGRLLETDPAFRLRREELLRASGAATVESIRSRIRALDGVTQVFVFENTSFVTDPSGLPGKSFEVVAEGGDPADITQEIWESKPAGIASFGSSSAVVTDSQGFNHTIYYSRPTLIPIWIELTVAYTPAEYPTDGDDQIKAALVALGESLTVGQDVIALSFKCAPLEVSGVKDVPLFEIDDVTPTVTDTNVTIDVRELADFDNSRITLAKTVWVDS